MLFYGSNCNDRLGWGSIGAFGGGFDRRYYSRSGARAFAALGELTAPIGRLANWKWHLRFSAQIGAA